MIKITDNGENEIIEVCGTMYKRIPIKTHLITNKDNIADVAEKYAKEHLCTGDILFVSEKAAACTQNRAIPVDKIRPGILAKMLSRFVYKSPYGIGLGIPETMEMALRECGIVRIFLASFISIIGKLIGKRGWFYKIAGYKAASIDGPTKITIPPYNKYVVLGPENPDKVAKSISNRIGVKCAIVDVNDLNGTILGISDLDLDKHRLVKILRDNPLGQSCQQTPMGIIRKVNP